MNDNLIVGKLYFWRGRKVQYIERDENMNWMALVLFLDGSGLHGHKCYVEANQMIEA